MIGVITASTKQSGTEIGNSLKSVLPRLTQQVGKDTLAGLGVALTDEMGNMRNVIDIYTEVANKIKDMNEVEKSAVVFGLGGTFHRTRLQALLDDLGSADSMYRKMYETSTTSAGSAERENEIYMNSLQARINSARVEVEKFAISLGEAFLTEGMITFLTTSANVLQGMTKLVNGIGALPIIMATVGAGAILLSKRMNGLASAIIYKSTSLARASLVNKGYTVSLEHASIAGKRMTIATSASAVAVRTLSTSKATATAMTTRFNTALQRTQIEASKATVATKALSVAGQTLKTAFLFTLPLVAIGILTEKLISATTKSRELREEAEKSNKEMVTSYKNNRDSVQELVTEYEKLEAVINSDSYDNDQLAQYYDIQNKLGELLPQLVTGESAYGQKLVETSSVIKSKTEMLERQLEIEKQIAEWQAKEDRNNRIESNEESVEDNLKLTEEKLKQAKRNLDYINNTSGSMSGSDKVRSSEIKSAEDLTKVLEKVSEARKQAEVDGDENLIEYYDRVAKSMMSYQSAINGADLNALSDSNALRMDYISELNDTLQNNVSIADESKEAIGNWKDTVLGLAEVENLDTVKNSLESLLISGTGEKEIVSYITNLEDLGSATTDTFESMYQDAEKSLSNLETALKGSLSAEELALVMSSLETSLVFTRDEFDNLSDEMNESGISFDQAKAGAEALSEGVSDAKEEVDSLADVMYKLDDAIEQMAGVSQKGVEALDNLVWQYESLSNQLSGYTDQQLQDLLAKEELTSAEQQIVNVLHSREAIMAQLATVYPELLNKDSQAIGMSAKKLEAIKKENEANKTLLRAYKLSRDGKLTAEQDATLASATATQERIRLIREEMNALIALSTAYEKMANAQIKLDDGENLSHNEQMALMYGSKFVANGTSAEIAKLNSELNTQLTNINSLASEIDVYSDLIEDSAESTKESTKATEENTKATKENAKEQSELEKITGKYATTLNKLNTALKEVESRKKKYPTYSAGYRKALEDENRLLQNQIDLRNQESEALKNVPKTVQVEYTSNSSTPTSQQSATYNGKLNGWNGPITDTYGSKRSNGTHKGIDIDGKIGDRLDANVSGTVDFAGNGKELGGRSWEYGNLVIIKDKDNNKHYYAHMNNVTVVKGQQIEAGTQIGAIGNTGLTSKGKGGDGSHLHYEVRNANNKQFNPNSYVTNAKNNVVPVYATTTTTPLKSNSTQDMVWNYFKQKGLSDEAVAGIMGNVMQESKFNASAVNTTSKASGLFQWLGTRKTGLMNYAKSVGKSWTDVQTQLDYAWKELQSSESKSLNSLQGSYSATQHAANFDKQFERSGGKEVKQRQQFATQFLGQYQGSGYSANGIVNGTYTATNPDYAKSLQDIEQNNQANLADQEKMAENKFAIAMSQAASYRRDVELENNLIAEQEILQERLLTRSKEYEASLNKQYTAEQRKVKSMQNEYDYLEKLIKSGQFNEVQIAEMVDRQAELTQEIENSKNASSGYKFEIITGRSDRYDYNRQLEDETISKQEVLQQSMLQHSKKYEASLNKQYTAENRKLQSYKDEYAYLQKMLTTEGLTVAQKDELIARQKELSVLAQESYDNAKAYYNEVVGANLARYDDKSNKNNNIINYEETKINSVDKTSSRYVKTLEKIENTQKKNLTNTQNELAYVEKMLAAGNLTVEMYNELAQRQWDLRAEIVDTTQAISDMVNRYLDLYNVKRNDSDNVITYENAKLKELDTNSERYTLTLQKIQREMQKKQKVNQDELAYLNQQIRYGGHSGEVLEGLKQQYADLTTTIKDASIELRELNFQMLTNIKTRADERIDDKEFSLDRSRAIQGMYEEGSADFMAEYSSQIKYINGLIGDYKQLIVDLQTEQNRTDLTSERFKEVNEMLEDATLTMLKWQSELLNTEKAMDESSKKKQEEVADDLIDLYKKYYDERKDAHMKALDKEMEAENERHENIMKNLDDERKKFKDNIDERLREIDRAEADRDYNMDINDSMSERNKIQAEINKLALDDSREAKAKRKKLQEELDKIDKDIEEKRHDHQIELQKQGLNDLAEAKDEEIDSKVKLEDEYHEDQIKKIEDLKEYWDKYYTDIVNDERKFAKVREDIIAGNFDNIRGEFGGFLTWMEDSMPDLENTLNGTMDSVGTVIRQNIIDNLREALDLLGKVQESTSTATNKYSPSSAQLDKGGVNFTNPNPKENSSGIATMSNGDMKVLLAKYMSDVVANKTTSEVHKGKIKDKAKLLASEGRKEGSSISASIGVEEALKGYGEADIMRLSQFVSSSDFGGLTTPEYQSMIKEWANKLRNGAASLDTGGLLKFKGSGIDGKGGRLIIGHPNEVYHNPIDTENLIDHSNMMMQVGRMFTPILQAFKSPTSLLSNLTNNGGDTFIVDFNVGEMIANKETANTFGNDILNALKTKRGMR